MSGNAESVVKHQTKLQESIEVFINSVGLAALSKPAKIEEYLSMTREQLNALTDEGCGEIAYILMQYSIWLQKEENKLIAQLNWAKSTLDAVVLPQIHNYSGYGVAEKRAKAESESESAKALIKVKIELQGLVDSLRFIASKVTDLKDCLLSLQQTKRAKRF